MRPKSIVLLLLAVGCGLVASIGISQVLESRKNQGESAGDMQPVFVAVTDINRADKLTPENVKLVEWPKSKLPDGTISKSEDLDGKHVRSKIYAGEPILAAKLFGPNDAEGPADQVPKGYRVCAVRVDAVSASGSLIRPGDRVDVLLYLSKNLNTGITSTGTRTILQDISVFAVDTAFVGQGKNDEQAAAAKTVSLLVTPSQAETVTLASEVGSIRLVLRSAGDAVQTEPGGKTVQQILGGAGEKTDREAERVDDGTKKGFLDFLSCEKQPAPVAVEPVHTATSSPWIMVVLRGGTDVKEVEFPADGSMPKDLLNDTPAAGPSDGLVIPSLPNTPPPSGEVAPTAPAVDNPAAPGSDDPAGEEEVKHSPST